MKHFRKFAYRIIIWNTEGMDWRIIRQILYWKMERAKSRWKPKKKFWKWTCLSENVNRSMEEFEYQKAAYIQVVRMQEGSTMNGLKQAQIIRCPEKKFCKICHKRVATTMHILLSFPVNKQK